MIALTAVIFSQIEFLSRMQLQAGVEEISNVISFSNDHRKRAPMSVLPEVLGEQY